MDVEERRRRLAAKHRLHPAARTQDVIAIADDLVALHSADPVTVFLSLWARMSEPSVAAVEDALYDDRTLIRHHAMRRTVWVMTVQMTEAAHAACTRKIAAAERKRTVAFLDGDEAWLDAATDTILDLLATEGPLTAREIGNRCPELARPLVLASGTRHAVTANGHTRALLQAGFEGRLVRGRPGSWTGSHYAWTRPDQWTAIDWNRYDELHGAVRLVGAWLDRFGPGTLDDIVWWTGATKSLIRRALGELDVATVDLGDGEGLMLASDDEPAGDPGPWVALLPALDPTAMGWKQRSWYLADGLVRRVVDRNGNIGPTVWADGRVVGGWAQRPDGTIATELAEPLSSAHTTLLDEEIDRLRGVLGDTRFRVRFPSPNQADLLG